MKIVSSRVYEGKNIYSHKKCIRIDLDLEGYSDIPSKDISGFNENLIRKLPELMKHECGIHEEHGFVKRLNEGTYLAHIYEHTIIAMQNMMGIDLGYGKARELQGERYYVVFQYEYKKTGLSIAKIALDLINSLINHTEYDLERNLDELRDKLKHEKMGVSTKAIYDEAVKREIPVIRIGDGSILQLGYGKYGKMVEATIGSNTRAIAVDIACDKQLTKEVLKSNCLPVAEGARVDNLEDLLASIKEIGFPVVIKPQFGNQGKEVMVNIKCENEAVEAYKTINSRHKEIIVEKYISGKDYRVCVIDGKVAAVSERFPPAIKGDGTKTVRELIDIMNLDEMRGEDHEKVLSKIKIDGELMACIESQGYELASVLPKDKELQLRRNANLSTGGKSVDCTDEISYENKLICESAAKAIGLDICGIDICCNDIGESLIETGGAIIEVNAAPGIRMHQCPCSGSSRDVASYIVNMLFRDSPKSIPVVAVTGTNGKTTVTRLISHTLSGMGHNTGMTTTSGIFVNNKCILKGDNTGPKSALAVLLNKEIDVAVLETARGGIVREGLAYDLADVAVITNITEDHIGIDEIENIEDLAKVKALVAEAVKKDGYAVINADDPVSLSIIDRITSKIIMFSKDRDNKVLKENLVKNRFIVYAHEGKVCVEENGKVFPVVDIDDVGITMKGKLTYNIENALAACAALVGLGVDFYDIAKGLMSFYTDENQNPGRFNVFNVDGRNVILDYGHNIDGYKAVLSAANSMYDSKLIGVIGVPGDRPDEHISMVADVSTRYFDEIYIKEDEDKRGRENGEVCGILMKGVLDAGFEVSKVKVVMDEGEALSDAIRNSNEGDTIITFFEDYEKCMKVINNWMQ